MLQLTVINISNPIFNSHVLKTLSNNKITTTLDFLREDVDKLATLTKLSLPDILALRFEILNKYSAPLIKAKDLYVEGTYKNSVLDTGIARLNHLIGGGLPLGSITEICGLAGVGKTQLCFQLSVNCAKQDCTVLYIDTKGDFSSTRIQLALKSSGCSIKDMGRVMKNIKVVRVWDMEELIKLFEELKEEVILIEKLKLVLIDSLPCLMFQHLGEDCKVGLKFLNLFVNSARFLSKKLNLSIVCVNIMTRWVEQGLSEVDGDENVCWKETKSRCLGRYWHHIPSIVLMIEESNNYQKSEECKIMTVNITKSAITTINESCNIIINSRGVFSCLQSD